MPGGLGGYPICHHYDVDKRNGPRARSPANNIVVPSRPLPESSYSCFQLGLLTNLTSLRLSVYSFSNFIPTNDPSRPTLPDAPLSLQLGLLTNLTSLRLSVNSFANLIPTQLGALTLLSELKLTKAALIGTGAH